MGYYDPPRKGPEPTPMTYVVIFVVAMLLLGALMFL